MAHTSSAWSRLCNQIWLVVLFAMYSVFIYIYTYNIACVSIVICLFLLFATIIYCCVCVFCTHLFLLSSYCCLSENTHTYTHYTQTQTELYIYIKSLELSHLFIHKQADTLTHECISNVGRSHGLWNIYTHIYIRLK